MVCRRLRGVGGKHRHARDFHEETPHQGHNAAVVGHVSREGGAGGGSSLQHSRRAQQRNTQPRNKTARSGNRNNSNGSDVAVGAQRWATTSSPLTWRSHVVFPGGPTGVVRHERLDVTRDDERLAEVRLAHPTNVPPTHLTNTNTTTTTRTTISITTTTATAPTYQTKQTPLSTIPAIQTIDGLVCVPIPLHVPSLTARRMWKQPSRSNVVQATVPALHGTCRSVDTDTTSSSECSADHVTPVTASE